MQRDVATAENSNAATQAKILPHSLPLPQIKNLNIW
jgi:hypothetical protein